MAKILKIDFEKPKSYICTKSIFRLASRVFASPTGLYDRN